jgi:hypothetical protein
MKSIKYGIILGIIGYIFGMAVGCGNLTYVKKSQRESIETAEKQIWGIIFGVGGLILGASLGSTDEKNTKLGIDKSETYRTKEGRKWIYYTKWVNPESNNSNIIITSFDITYNKVSTKFNDSNIYFHDSSSGSDAFISKTHSNDKSEIIQKIRKGELQQI